MFVFWYFRHTSLGKYFKYLIFKQAATFSVANIHAAAIYLYFVVIFDNVLYTINWSTFLYSLCFCKFLVYNIVSVLSVDVKGKTCVYNWPVDTLGEHRHVAAKSQKAEPIFFSDVCPAG